MDVHLWDTPIRATWHKSNTLVDLKYAPDLLELLVHEEETRMRWRISFKDLAAFKIIVGDNAHWSRQPLPPDAGFFQITESPWLSALGLTETNDQELVRHYVICCRRELIEIAARDATFAPE
jgi:hypothetical protein